LLKDYRDWLEAELKLLSNASHHAYAFGQANMAKRALERLDDELAKTLYVPIDRAQARRILTEIAMQAQSTTAALPALQALHDVLATSLAEANENPAL
jgi:hypothetical protein